MLSVQCLSFVSSSSIELGCVCLFVSVFVCLFLCLFEWIMLSMFVCGITRSTANNRAQLGHEEVVAPVNQRGLLPCIDLFVKGSNACVLFLRIPPL